MLRNLNELKARIASMKAGVRTWQSQVAEEERVLWKANTISEGNFFRRKAETWRLARLKVRDPSHEETFSVLDELCDHYLITTSDERIVIRDLLGDAIDCLLSYAESASDQITSTGDVHWLRRGLAALSIVDGRLDFRDTFACLRELYLASARAEIDPLPYVREVAEISSTTSRSPGRGSMHDLLVDFDKSAFFREDVQPELPKKEVG
jgi:hypothetical protein